MNPYDNQSVYNLAQLLQQTPNSAMKLGTNKGSGQGAMALAGMLTKSAKPTPATASQVSALNSGAGPVSPSYANTLDQNNSGAFAQLAGTGTDQNFGGADNSALNLGATSGQSSY